MNATLRTRCLRFAFLMGSGLFLVCCTGGSGGSGPDSVEKFAVVAKFGVPPNQAYQLPDSVHWSTSFSDGTATHFAGIEPASSWEMRRCSVAVMLPAPLGRDTFHVDLWRHGVRFAQLAYLDRLGPLDLFRLDRAQTYDYLALELLEELEKSDLAQNREGIVGLYASWILAGDARVAGYPGAIPFGLDAQETSEAVLLAAARRGSLLSDLAKVWSLGITLDSAKILAVHLMEVGKMDIEDTARLFSLDSGVRIPPPPRP